MKGKVLPILLMLVFALSRIPGLLPQNFSAAYAHRVLRRRSFSRGAMAWWLPLGTLLVTDIGLNCSTTTNLVFESGTCW